jgi:uncharacterized protein YkwD
VYPSAYDQYLVQLINQARANPSAVAASFNIDLNEGLTPGTISASAKQPLAINPFLVDSARGHSGWMLDTNLFQHEGPGTASPGDRMGWAGYTFTPPWSWGENIGWRGNTQSYADYTQGTAQLNQDLFVDQGIDDRGHRINMLDADYKEVGTGVIAGIFTQSGTDYKSLMATEDFANTAGNSFLTGVAFNDAVTHDQFYTPGEGLGGVTITAKRLSDNAVFTTATWDSGGYNLQLAPGTYQVTAAGPGLNGSVGYGNVVIGNQNVERDFTPATPVLDFTPPTAALASAPDITTGGPADYTFTIAYNDNVAINSGTIGDSNIVVTGPGGFSAPASLVGVDSSAGPTSLRAVYRISAPGGSWNTSDGGDYRIRLANNQVADTSGNFVPGASLGVFTVNIPAPIPPETAPPNNDPAPLLVDDTIITGADPGQLPMVRGFNPGDQSQRFQMLAFDAGFTGGVRVATGDVTGDGTPDLIVAPGPGAGPNVRVFDGKTGRQINGPLGSFYAYDPGFDGGVFVASADVNGDGRADIITGTSNGPPNVKVFSGSDGSLLASFFANDPTFLGGARVAGGDVNADGRADVITAPGPGAPAAVKVFDGRTFNLMKTFDAYAGYQGGVYVAAGDTNHDGRADIITAAQGVPHVKVFSGSDNSLLASFMAYPGFQGGVRVGAADIDGDGMVDVLTAVGPGAGPHVKAFSSGHAFNTVQSFFAGDPGSDVNGLYIA